MRKILSIAIILCLLMALCLTVHATAPRLVDNGELLTDAEATQLEKKLDEISTRHGLDIVVVTVDSTGGKTPETFADDWFDYNDYGKDGILLLVSMEYSDWHISTTGYGIKVVTDAGLEYMSEHFLPMLSDGEYADAFHTFADLCDEFVAQANTGDPYDTHNLPKEPFNVVLTFIISLGIGLVAALIVTGPMKRELKSVRKQLKADAYVNSGSLKLTNAQDLFLYTKVIKTERPQSSGSSTHTSSSGNTHGGGGGKF